METQRKFWQPTADKKKLPSCTKRYIKRVGILSVQIILTHTRRKRPWISCNV